MVRSFQKDIRKTLTQYALVPLVIIAVLGSLLGLWGWQHDVKRRSEDTRLVAAEVLNTLFSDYMARIEFVAKNDACLHIDDVEKRRALYEWLYHEVNISHDNTRFYLLDTSGNILLGNYKNLPPYLQDVAMNWGIWQRALSEPQKTVVEFSPRMRSQNSDLLMARAVVDNSTVKGYWLFVLDGNYIANAINSGYLDLALVNKFDYASITTNPMLQNAEFQTLPKSFMGKNHEIASWQKHDYYITNQVLTAEGVVLYSVMSVSELEARYKLAVLILLIVLGLMIPVLLYRVHKERLNRAKAKANVVSEVRQLEAQFHPHFIFNTLENIKFMVKLNPEAAMKMIVSLSSILRYGINNLIQEVTLAEDFKYTNEYLEIMKYRFGRRLSWEFDIQVDMSKVWIPKLIFQPILENAIKYGEAEDGSIRIGLKAVVKGDSLLISVVNGGLPMGKDKLQMMQELLQSENNFSVHTGIYNVHRRLRLMYGKRYGVSVHCPDIGGTVVELKLPLIKEQKNAEGSNS